MSESQDSELRMLLSKLNLLDQDSMARATAIEGERKKSGAQAPFAALLVQKGLVPYDVMEQVLAHQANVPLVCKSCDITTGASELDPRSPFRCLACGRDVEPTEAPAELTAVDTMAGDPAAKKSESDLVGRVLGQCKIERKVGEGGMGVVYEATHQFLKRRVAVKVLPEHHVHREGFIQRFLRESRSAAQVIHPNVVQVMDAGQDGEIHFIVMEYMEGKSLYRHLKDDGAMRPYKALHYAKQAAMGLAAAAKFGIVHRDVKPDNIQVSPDGLIAKIADFGLAKQVEGAEKITRTGTVVGTPLYMSPEQAEAKPVDHRSDIYSLGATLYHLMSGRPPFRGHSAIAIIQKHRTEKPAPLKRIATACPPEAEAMVLKMMAKKPDERFQTYADLILAMEDALTACRSASSQETVIIRARPGAVPRWVVVAIAAAVIVLGVLGYLYLTRTGDDDSKKSGRRPARDLPKVAAAKDVSRAMESMMDTRAREFGGRANDRKMGRVS